MTIPADSRVCTPQSFFKGLYLLMKNILGSTTPVLALLVFPVLLLTGSSISALQDGRASMTNFAIAALVALSVSIGCAVLAYQKEPHRVAFMLAGLMSFMAHMLFATVTLHLLKNTLPVNGSWWQDSSTLVKAAILPTYGSMLLVALALGLGTIGLAGWALFKLPAATKAVTRHVCQLGQNR